MSEKLVLFAVAAIEAYLDAHPDAADTAEGIHQWWIRWPGPPESLSVTKSALKRLEKAGRLERRPVAKGELWRRCA